MSTASLAAPQTGAAARFDLLFLALSIGATAILIALVLLDGEPASAALLLGGFALGVAFLKAEFSYTASWRRFLTRGEAGGLLGGLIVIAVTALAVVPVAALKSNFGGAIAPLVGSNPTQIPYSCDSFSAVVIRATRSATRSAAAFV